MEFDINKVVHPFSTEEEKRKYVGKKCVFADMLDILEHRVSIVNDEPDILTGIADKNSLEGIEYPFISTNNYGWRYIYPVSEKEKKLVPFDTVEELIDCWKKKHPAQKIPADCMPLIWIKGKETGTKFLIQAFKKNAVFVYDFPILTGELFRLYTFLDDTAIGKEVVEA